jgi:hypothetical protein
MDITEEYKKLLIDREHIELNNNDALLKIINNIMRSQILNIKSFICNFQKTIYSIKNNIKVDFHEYQEVNYYSTKINRLIDTYNKKLLNIKLVDEKDENLIFKNWQEITNINLTEIKDMKKIENNKIIDINLVIENNSCGNILINYFIEEINKLLNYNNKVLKKVINSFIIDYINISFDLFNKEILTNNLDIKYFMYLINSETYAQEIEEDIYIEMGEEENVDINPYTDNEEEQEKITEAWEEEFYDGLEELGWSCNDTDYILEGPLELLDADDNIVGQGDPS